MSIIKTLEKVAEKENIYDVLNASGLGNKSTVLASKAKPQYRDIVHNHSSHEIKTNGAVVGGLGLLAGGTVGAGLGALIGKISKKGAKPGAMIGATALGLPALMAGGAQGKKIGEKKAIKDLRKAKLI